MITEKKNQKKDYVVLLIFLASFLVLFVAVWPNILLQRALVLMLGLVYFFWGITHHHRHGMITVKLVLEYFFVSLFACSLLILLTT